MATSQIVSTLGDSLRDIAARVDGVPALAASSLYPDVPFSLSVVGRTALGVEALARDFGVHTRESIDLEAGTVHTWFEVDAGPIVLRVFAIEPLPREVRRATSITEQLEADL